MESTARGTLTMRMTRTIPAIPPLATVKAHQTGILMRPRVCTVMKGVTSKMEVRRWLCTRKMTGDCMRVKKTAFTRMTR